MNSQAEELKHLWMGIGNPWRSSIEVFPSVRIFTGWVWLQNNGPFSLTYWVYNSVHSDDIEKKNNAESERLLTLIIVTVFCYVNTFWTNITAPSPPSRKHMCFSATRFRLLYFEMQYVFYLSEKKWYSGQLNLMSTPCRSYAKTCLRQEKPLYLRESFVHELKPVPQLILHHSPSGGSSWKILIHHSLKNVMIQKVHSCSL